MIRSRSILWQASRAVAQNNKRYFRTQTYWSNSATGAGQSPTTSPSLASSLTGEATTAAAPSPSLSEVKSTFRNVFLEAFEQSNAPNSGYDVSQGELYDPVLNGEEPSADDLKLRIERYLQEGKDISRLLSTSVLESYDSLLQKWLASQNQVCSVPYKRGNGLEYMTQTQFSGTIQVVRWQVMRNSLLQNEDGGLVVKRSRNSLSSERNAAKLLQFETIYLKEMERLYSLTGVEQIKYHVVQTTPAVMKKILVRYGDKIKSLNEWLALNEELESLINLTADQQVKNSRGETAFGAVGEAISEDGHLSAADTNTASETTTTPSTTTEATANEIIDTAFEPGTVSIDIPTAEAAAPGENEASATANDSNNTPSQDTATDAGKGSN
jgi:hypothetical protein